MESRGRARPLTSERTLCVNCNICINPPTPLRSFLVLQQKTPVISLISNWLSPLIITEEDYICGACFDLAIQAVNAELHRDIYLNDRCSGPSLRGHREVCLICGRSVAKKQSHQILRQTSPYHTEMIQIVENSIAPREIQSHDSLCHACYVHVERSAVRNQRHDERRIMENIHDSEDALAIQEVKRESSEMPQNQEQLTVIVPAAESGVLEESTLSEDPETLKHQQEQPSLPNATLRNYRRAPNTASHCIFHRCDNITSLHSISDALRRTLLINHKYYVPIHTKVCSEHLRQNSWHCLYDSENSMSSFTVQQIEHMLSFIGSAKPFLDFSSMASVEEMDDHLFGYWMGMTKENFLCLLTETPRIQETHRGILGLACILIKMRTGDSDQQMATLLKVSRQTIERKMAIVRHILLQ